MAVVPYNPAPEVEARVQAPDDYQRVEASPNAFGAQLAGAVGQVGQDAIDASKFYGTVAADHATNNLTDLKTKLLYGDPSKPAVDASGQPILGPDGTPVGQGGFYSLRGMDAMNAAAGVSKQYDDLLTQQRATLKTPESQLQFDNFTRRQRSLDAEQMGRFNDQQMREWALSTNTNGIALTQNSIANHLNNPDALAADQQAMRGYYVKRDTLQFGHDPSVANAAVMKADQDWATTQIKAAIGNNDPMTAQKVFNDNNGILGSLPSYDQLGRTIKAAVIDATMTPAINSAVTDAFASAGKFVGSPATGKPEQDYSTVPFAQIKNRLGEGEGAMRLGGYNAIVYNQPGGGNKYGIPQTNLTGMTIGQVIDFQNNVINPATRGKPGAPANGTSAAGRYQFEAATLASQAAAVLGSDWKDQPFSAANQDKMAEHLYDQVRNNPAALHAQWPSLVQRPAYSAYPSLTDALVANMPAVMEKAQTDAERMYPNYPEAQQQYVTGVQRHIDQAIAQQRQQYEVDSHVVQSAVEAGHMISEQQLIHSSPEAAAAWQSMQANNPYGAMAIERMFSANGNGVSTDYGTGFKDALDRTLAPRNDPSRLSDPSQLWGMVGSGPDSPLTNSGANQLADLQKGRGTPHGEANAAMIRGFVDRMYGQISYASPNVPDPKGEAQFGKFMAATLPQLVSAAKEGNLADLVNPNSKNYLGHTAAALMRTPAQMVSDRIHGEGFKADNFDNPLTMNGLRMAVSEGKIQPQEAAWIANRMGFQKQSAPAQKQQVSAGEAGIDAFFQGGQ